MYYLPGETALVTAELVADFSANPELFIRNSTAIIGEEATQKIHNLSSRLTLLDKEMPRFSEHFTIGRIVGAVSIQQKISQGALHEGLNAEFGTSGDHCSELAVAISIFNYCQIGAQQWFDSNSYAQSLTAEMAVAAGAGHELSVEAFAVGIGSLAAMVNVTHHIKLDEGEWPLHSCVFSDN